MDGFSDTSANSGLRQLRHHARHGADATAEKSVGWEAMRLYDEGNTVKADSAGARQ